MQDSVALSVQASFKLLRHICYQKKITDIYMQDGVALFVQDCWLEVFRTPCSALLVETGWAICYL